MKQDHHSDLKKQTDQQVNQFVRYMESFDTRYAIHATTSCALKAAELTKEMIEEYLSHHKENPNYEVES